MKRMRMVGLLCLLSAIGRSQDVRFAYDSNQAFDKFRTYKWVHIQGTDELDPLTRHNVRAIVDLLLRNKHLTRTEEDHVDLLVAHQVSIGNQKQFIFFADWRYGSGWTRKWYGGWMNSRIEDPTMIRLDQVGLDIYNATNKTLAWRGIASHVLDVKATPEKGQEDLKKTIRKLLKHYPPSEGGEIASGGASEPAIANR
jgi:hypothetical protein